LSTWIPFSQFSHSFKLYSGLLIIFFELLKRTCFFEDALVDEGAISSYVLFFVKLPALRELISFVVFGAFVVVVPPM
jgi:hypothetical protein